MNLNIEITDISSTDISSTDISSTDTIINIRSDKDNRVANNIGNNI
jgi:hypothetical protein